MEVRFGQIHEGAVSVLRQVFELLLQRIEEIDGPDIEPHDDFFWSIPMNELYDDYHNPSELTIGQLSECLEHLEKMNEDPDRVISYGLVWLAEILLAVSLAWLWSGRTKCTAASNSQTVITTEHFMNGPSERLDVLPGRRIREIAVSG